MTRKLILFVMATLFLWSAYAQNEGKTTWVQKLQKKDRSWFVTPLVYYTPETRWAFGAAAVGFFKLNKSDSLSPISTAGLSFAYTSNDQILFSIPFRLYFKENQFRISGDVDFYRYPYFFAGIGNSNPPDYKENYNASFPRLRGVFMQRFASGWYTGPSIFIQNTTILDREAGGQLETGNIPGSSGGLVSGMGWEVQNDKRDNIYAPLKGHFMRMSVLFYDDAFLSDFSFNHFEIDLRKYWPFYKKHVLAFQTYGEYNFGEVPFNRMAQLGGPRMMRGYKIGALRDQHYSSAQVEYRTPIWGVFGLTAFASTGTVASSINNFNTTDMKFAYGGGIRFAFNQKERIHLRLDYARAIDRDEFYFTVAEAF